jgi:hypothetical protein
LHHYRNRFPQVTAGTRLFRKIPRIAGISGWDVQGKELAPEAVKDFDIATLAGPGTEVKRDGGECVVATMDGFLDIDAQSGQISVLDKIVSREGVSMRTTGDLSLAGDDYEEHGEVQEKRVVEGHNMTFLADIFGKIVSDGGRVTLKRNISGGAIQNAGGGIFIEGGASRSLLEARRGSVTANHAETCVIVADKVTLGRAIRCDIVADEVEIQSSEGSSIAAKRVTIKSATERKDDGTVVTLLMPDLSRFEREAARLEDMRREAAAEIAASENSLAELAALPDMKTYLTIQPRIKAGMTMGASQQVQWQALLARIAPTLRQMAGLNGDMKAAQETIAETAQELAALALERQTSTQGICCNIEAVAGFTTVRTLRQSFDEKPLANLAPKDLHMRLREAGDASARLFSDDSGSFEWQPPAEDATAAEQVGAADAPGPASGQD